MKNLFALYRNKINIRLLKANGWSVASLIFCSIICISCKSNETIIPQAKEQVPSNQSFDQEDELKEIPLYFSDTITAHTPEELILNIQNNRVIRLLNGYYQFYNPIMIDGIDNLKIVGTELSKLDIRNKNTTVLKLMNAQNIYLENLILGHSENPGLIEEQGAISINHCSNISISNCFLLSAGNIGLVANDVNNLSFSQSEIKDGALFLFDLEKSRNCRFSNSRFHKNEISASVLGGFTNGTKDVVFDHCSFLNNTPKMPGNPAFNFYENDKEYDQPIVFSNCTFKNNKGYVWYGKKIKLIDCKVDSTDFIDFPRD